jgi:ribosomal protein L7/L12
MSLTETTLKRIQGLLDAGKKIDAIKLHRQVTNMGLKESKEAVEAIVRKSEGVSREDVPHDALVQEVMELLRDGRKINAIKRYRAATGVGLKEAKEAVEAIARKSEGVSREDVPQDALVQEVIELLRDGRKINAIKRYRAATGVGLKEAKEAVEAIVRGEFEGAADTHERASAPISPAQPVTDLLLFTDHETPSKQLYLPRYRLATQQVGMKQDFDVQVEDDPSGGGTLTLRLLPYPAPGIEEEVRDSAVAPLPHTVSPSIVYSRSGSSSHSLAFDEVEDLEDGFRTWLHLNDTGGWHELKTALRETDRNAHLIVQRTATVAVRQERATEMEQQQKRVEELRAQQQALKRRAEEAQSEIADLRQRERKLRQERNRLRLSLHKGAKVRNHRTVLGKEINSQVRKVRGSARNHQTKTERTVRRRDHRAGAKRRGNVTVRDHRKGTEREGRTKVRDHRADDRHTRIAKRMASVNETLKQVSKQKKNAEANAKRAGQRLENVKDGLRDFQKAQQELSERPTFVNQTITCDHTVNPDPFVVLSRPMMGPSREEMASVLIAGRRYHWDSAQPEVVFDLPDRFVLAHYADPPHLPNMRLRFDTAGVSDAQDVIVELEYHAEPVYDEDRREDARDQLRHATGAAEVRFDPYPAKQPTFKLVLPFGSEEEDSSQIKVPVDLETGIYSVLRMNMANFQKVYAALFGGSLAYMRGEVYVKTGETEIHEIPLELRVETLEPDQVYDAILDGNTATTLARPVTVQAFFAPLTNLPGLKIRQIGASFRGAPDVTLTPGEPLQEVPVPRPIRSVVLSGVDPEAIDGVDTYQYKLTFVLMENGEKRFVRDEEWRSGNEDTLLPELWLEELLT